jgi:hypothetical protein
MHCCARTSAPRRGRAVAERTLSLQMASSRAAARTTFVSFATAFSASAAPSYVACLLIGREQRLCRAVCSPPHSPHLRLPDAIALLHLLGSTRCKKSMRVRK